MSSENYSVAVKLSLVENVSKGLVAMAGKFSMLSKQSDIFQAKLNSLKSQIATGAGMVAFGTALAAPLILATNQAGKLQQQLKMVQIATQASEAQMVAFHQSISSTALGSIFSVTDVAKMAKTLSTAGNFSIQQVQSLVPEFVKYAQTQNLLKGTNYEKSTEQAIKIAEITGNFDPKSIDVTLNALSKLSFVMPGSIDKVLSAFKYMEGTMKNVMGMSDENSLLLVALLQRMGMEGTRAGTQLINFVSRTIPQVFGSGLWEGKSLPNLQAMGLLDATGVPKIFTNGKVDPMKLFHNLGDFITRDFQRLPEAAARTDIMRKFQQTFGTTGTRLAAILTTPNAIKQFEEIQAAYKSHPNLDVISEQINGLLSKQLPQVFSGLKTVFTDLGYALLPDAVKGLSYFNDQLKRLDNWINTHQSLVRKIEEITLAFAGLLIVGGILTIVRAGIMGLIIPFQLFATILPPLAAGILALDLPAVLIIGAVIAVGVALYELYKHWDYVKLKIQQLYAAFKDTTVYKVVASAINSVNSAFHTLVDSLKYVYNTIANFTKNFSIAHPTVSKAIGRGIDVLASPITAPIHAAQSIAHRVHDYFYPPVVTQAVNTRNVNRMVIAGHSANMQHAQNQPIHVHVNMDGRKVAHVVANHIYNSATNMPNSSSQFDTNLSPMPTVANSIGITR